LGPPALVLVLAPALVLVLDPAPALVGPAPPQEGQATRAFWSYRGKL